jgi:hypothetical protein
VDPRRKKERPEGIASSEFWSDGLLSHRCD